MLTIQDIKEIIKIVDQSSIQKFQLEHETSKIVIEKESLLAAKPNMTATESCKEDVSKTTGGRSVEEDGNSSTAVNMVEDHKTTELHEVVSPMVGTFYAAPEPGADPFVKIGQKVNSDTVVCIIESMKLFNEVEAGVTGEIVEILRKDGEPVEYGQPLFLIRAE